MKPSLQAVLDEAYHATHSAAGLNDTTFRRLAALVDHEEARLRLASLTGIAEQRCHISAVHRRFLERVLATRP